MILELFLCGVRFAKFFGLRLQYSAEYEIAFLDKKNEVLVSFLGFRVVRKVAELYLVEIASLRESVSNLHTFEFLTKIRNTPENLIFAMCRATDFTQRLLHS